MITVANLIVERCIMLSGCVIYLCVLEFIIDACVGEGMHMHILGSHSTTAIANIISILIILFLFYQCQLPDFSLTL